MNVTKEAVEILADKKGVTILEILSQLQAAAAALKDEVTLDALCGIKSEILGL